MPDNTPADIRQMQPVKLLEVVWRQMPFALMARYN